MTLATMLRETYNKRVNYVKRDAPEDPLAEGAAMREFFERTMASDDFDFTIVDRFVASELVMTMYTDRVPYEARAEECRLLSIDMKNAGVYHYILQASLANLDSRLAARGTRQHDMPRGLIRPLWMYAFFTLEGVGFLFSNSLTPETLARQIIEDIGLD